MASRQSGSPSFTTGRCTGKSRATVEGPCTLEGAETNVLSGHNPVLGNTPVSPPRHNAYAYTMYQRTLLGLGRPHNGVWVLGGDRCFAQIASGTTLHGSLLIALVRQGKGTWLHHSAPGINVSALYQTGHMSWNISICSTGAKENDCPKLWVGLAPLANDQGAIATVELTGGQPDDQVGQLLACTRRIAMFTRWGLHSCVGVRFYSTTRSGTHAYHSDQCLSHWWPFTTDCLAVWWLLQYWWTVDWMGEGHTAS